MILTQIGEQANVKADARHPLEAECMGGDFHDHVGASRIRHSPEETVELKGFRCGALGVERLISDHVLVGADEAHLGLQALFQHVFKQVGGGGFSIGAGDAHHGHRGSGISEPVPAQLCQGFAAVRDQHKGNVPLRLFLTEHAPSAFFQSHGDEPVAVGFIAGHGHKEVPRLHQSGVVANAGDVHIKVRFQPGNINALQ